MRFVRSLVCLLVFAAPLAAASRPNVLLIAIDDFKPLLGCYGDQTVKSPHLDRLASRGVLFESAYCNQSVCAPSRNSLLTGLRPTTVGIYDLGTNFRLATPEAVTIAQYFKQHGWRTEALGKVLHIHQGNHEDAPSWSVPHWDPMDSPASSYALERNQKKSPPIFTVTRDRADSTESADVPDNAYPDGQVADEAIRRLRAAKERSPVPFFLAVGFHKPHLPFCAPKKYWDLYDRAQLPLPAIEARPAGAPAYAPNNWGDLRLYTDIPSKGALSEDEKRRLIHGYHAAVSFVDAQVGRVMAEIDRLGFAENTIVVVWGDHGFHLGEHNQWSKQTNYENAARIPLIVIAPGVAKPGTRTRALAETVDVYPTLVELAGLPAPRAPAVPQGLDGRSFAATLRDPAAPTKDAVFHVSPRNRPGGVQILGRAVRTARHRLVEWKAPGAAPATAEIELYDYVADPLESKNLAAGEPAVVARLRGILAAQPEAKPQFKKK
jgi:iduronate 2-sulfatase